MAHPPSSAQPATDATALQRAERRLQAAPQPPWLHAEVARRMLERLDVIKQVPLRVLDCSGPAGASLALLRARYPKADVRAEGGMAAEISWWQRWRRSSAPGASAGSVRNIELLWSNMQLHRSADISALFAHWHQALSVGGMLMFSTLGPATLAGLRRIYQGRGWPAPHAPFADMHDVGDMLVHAGFVDPVMDQETVTLTWDKPQALLDELQSLGGNSHPARHAGLRTPRWRAQLLDALAELAGPDARPQLQFELVYGHAVRAAPRARIEAETTVGLEDMRAMMRAGRRSGAGGSQR